MGIATWKEGVDPAESANIGALRRVRAKLRTHL